MADESFQITSEVCKVNEALGLVFGWAIVCKENGRDHFDLQDDAVTEAGMLDAAADFMANSRAAKAMHKGDPVGSILFAFPMTGEIAKSLGIHTDKTGLLIGMKPDAVTLGKFKTGEFTGFSIGGVRIVDEEVDDD